MFLSRFLKKKKKQNQIAVNSKWNFSFGIFHEGNRVSGIFFLIEFLYMLLSLRQRLQMMPYPVQRKNGILNILLRDVHW